MHQTVPSPTSDAPDFTRADVQAHYIEQAAAHIERYGLHAGGYWPTTFGDNGLQIDDSFGPGMPCCTVGAIAVVLDVHEPVDVDTQILGHNGFTGDVTPHPVLAALMYALCATEVEQVFSWSDSARDDQVVARLRYIAAQLRPQVERGTDAQIDAYTHCAVCRAPYRFHEPRPETLGFGKAECTDCGFVATDRRDAAAAVA